MTKKASTSSALPIVQLEPFGNLLLDNANPRLAELTLSIKEQDLQRSPEVTQVCLPKLTHGSAD